MACKTIAERRMRRLDHARTMAKKEANVKKESQKLIKMVDRYHYIPATQETHWPVIEIIPVI